MPFNPIWPEFCSDDLASQQVNVAAERLRSTVMPVVQPIRRTELWLWLAISLLAVFLVLAVLARVAASAVVAPSLVI